MAERKPKPGSERWPLIVEADGALVATWREHRVRFLLSDGRTIDVMTARDDSDLRGAVLDYLGGGALAIVGSVVVEDG